MKTSIKNLFLLPALMACLGLILASSVTAQTFTNLHSFTATSASSGFPTNSDGVDPVGTLILLGNTLFGTAGNGGSYGEGTVFAVNTDGRGFATLHSFTAISAPNYTNSDGAGPNGGLILSGNTLYGTASGGGSSGVGTVFSINTNGTGFATLHSFTSGSAGAYPLDSLILSGNTLYGTTGGGNGGFGNGTVFAINTDGTGFATLHSFTAKSGSDYTNSDGANPYAGLILSGNTLYGTAGEGGSSGYGTVFAINTDGTRFATLHRFTATSGGFNADGTNSDGANPEAELIISGNTLYGTAYNGGISGNGTIFAVNTNGTGFTTLYNFTDSSDGANPYAGLTLFGNTLYGTASGGGNSGEGTVFQIETNGTGFATLYSFSVTSGLSPHTNSDGANPNSELILSANTLYGTASGGGSSARGTVFSLSLPPQTIIIDQPQPVLINARNTASFSVTATGVMPLSYQWSLNGTNISGATGSTLTITNAAQTNLGSYLVVVTNAYATATSSNATLSMYPFIANPFTGAVTYWGKNATLSVEAWGTGALDYQWFDDGNAISGATNEDLTLTTIQATNAGLYSVVITSALGSATNPPAQVVVEPAGVSVALYPGVTINGVVGYNYIIQSTANLTDTNSWVTMTNLTLTQPIELWMDTNTDASIPANSQRFYQVLPGQ